MLDIEIRELPAVRVACVRHVGPYTELAPSFQRICGWAGAKGLMGPGSRVMGIFHDDPETVAAAELRSAAAVTVPDSVQPDGDVEITDIPAGTYAVGVFKGPYERLNEAYGWVKGEWFPRSGQSWGEGPCYEVYLNDPTSVPADEVLTALHLPLG